MNYQSTFVYSLATACALIVSGCASYSGSVNRPPATPPAPISSGCNCGAPSTSATPAVPTPPAPPPPAPAYIASSFEALPGWANQAHAVSFRQFQGQCANLSKRNSPLAPLCKQPLMLQRKLVSDSEAQQWFERNFSVYQLQQADEKRDGLFTGYFEPMLRGSRDKRGPFTHPLFATPADLITVELSDVYPQLKGLRLRGKVVGDKLVAYPTREGIERDGGTQPNSTLKPLVWVDDALDAFLLQVQGSGRIQLSEGTTLRLSYANQNGHPYVAIGKVLIQWGELTSEQATIPGIRAWAEKNPSRLVQLLNQNPSVVFFKDSVLKNPDEGPNGSLGVPLTPARSAAVDPTITPLGSPVFISTTRPDNGSRFDQLLLAQDTGGAIKGRVRADIFWGWGAEPGRLAGITRQTGQMWLLWPKDVELPK